MDHSGLEEIKEEENLLKKIGVPPPGARNNNLAITNQVTEIGNNQLVSENMINIGIVKDKVF